MIFTSSLNSTSFDELNQLGKIQKDLSEEILKLKEKIADIKKVKFVQLKDIESKINIEQCYKFEDVNDGCILEKNELINCYTKFVDNIQSALSIHFTKRRNYKICEDNKKIENILEILKENASAQNITAITSLGFMFFHGIIVEQSEILALNYFKKAASLGCTTATYMCYNLLSKYESKKFEYLAKALFMQSERAINQFGYLNETGKINQMPPSYKSAFQFYKKAAEKGCPVAFRNVALYLQNGYGVTQNIDSAAKWYKLAISKGYWEAKEELDDIYDQTVNFKSEHPNYEKWIGPYSEFENQPILLL